MIERYTSIIYMSGSIFANFFLKKVKSIDSIQGTVQCGNHLAAPGKDKGLRFVKVDVGIVKILFTVVCVAPVEVARKKFSGHSVTFAVILKKKSFDHFSEIFFTFALIKVKAVDFIVYECNAKL